MSEIQTAASTEDATASAAATNKTSIGDKLKSAGSKIKETGSDAIGRVKNKFKAIGADINKTYFDQESDAPKEVSVDNKYFSYPMYINEPGNENAAPHIRITAFEYKRKDNETALHQRVYGFAAEEKAPGQEFNPIDGMSVNFLGEFNLPFYGSLTQGYDSGHNAFNNLANAFSQTDFSELGGDASAMWKQISGLASGAMDDPMGALKVIAGSPLAKMGAAQLGRAATSALAGNGFKTDINAFLAQAGVSFGVAVNPMTELAYTGEEMQKYNLSFTLIPTSREEHAMIDSLIARMRELRAGSRTLNSSRLLINYPAIFNIDWLTAEGKPIIGPLPSGDCYLDSLSVVFNPFGRSYLYAGDMPVAYQLNLGFAELRAMYRDDIQALREFSSQPEIGSLGDYQSSDRVYLEDGKVDHLVGRKNRQPKPADSINVPVSNSGEQIV